MPITKEQAEAIQVRLNQIDAALQAYADQIAALFPDDYRVTIVVRTAKNMDATFVTTQEPDLRDVIPSVEHLIKTKHDKQKHLAGNGGGK